MSDEEMWQQRDLEEREQKALDCLTVVHVWGHEGTADELAALLGLSRQWQEIKHQSQRIAA